MQQPTPSPICRRRSPARTVFPALIMALSAVALLLAAAAPAPVDARAIGSYGHVDPTMNAQSLSDLVNCSLNWKVKTGDSCATITSSYVGLTDDMIVNLNTGFTCTSITSYVGQLLCLEASGSDDSTSSSSNSSSSSSSSSSITQHICYLNHTLTETDLDNVFVFAASYNVSIKYIMTINSIQVGHFPSAGTTICVKDNSDTPTSETTTTTTTIQTIVPIDGCSKTVTANSSTTCASIAAQEGYSLVVLYSLNTINCAEPLSASSGTATVCVEAPSVAASLKHSNSSSSGTATGTASVSSTSTSDTPTPTPSSSFDSDTSNGISMTNSARGLVGSPSLSWDSSYATLAQQRADHIASDYAGCAMPSDHEGYVYENSAWWAMTPGYTYPTDNWLVNAVQAWWDENYYGSYNHYTQLTWYKATVFGCAYAHGEDGACMIAICEYDVGNTNDGSSPVTYADGTEPSY
ncbi:hypothetical protein HK405_008277 [Cladochytrium tenue]|nr:hypothetical protein HK405_008277 [Cladochytrium tenue]